MIKQIISSSIEPSRNVLWLDGSSSGSPVLKTFKDNKWVRVQASSLTDPVVSYATVNYVDSGLLTKADLVGGKVPSTQLPSYVDDVIEGTYDEDNDQFSVSETVVTPESGKIYISTDTGYQYRWSGSTYSRMNEVDFTNYVNTYSTQIIEGEKIFNEDCKLRTKYLYPLSGNVPEISITGNSTMVNCGGTPIVTKVKSGLATFYGYGDNSSMIRSYSDGNHYQVAGVDYLNMYNNQILAYKPIISTSTLSATSLTATGLTSTGIVTNTSAGLLGTTTDYSTLSTQQTFTGAKAFSKGLISYGDSGTLPTGLGAYVANYVSSTYGARTTAFNGISYVDYNIGARIGTTGSVFAIMTKADGTTTFGSGITATSITDSALTTAGIVTNTSAGVIGTTTTVPIANGGTNATTAASALTNLGLIDNSSSGYFDIGTMRMQWGTVSTASGVSVTLPAAFANSTYSLVTTANCGSTVGSGTVQISSKTTTTFTPIKIYVASGGVVSAMGESFCYIAIGLKP